MFEFIVEQHHRGGPLFMGSLTVVALLVLVAAARAALARVGGHEDGERWLHAVFHLGLLALLLGIFSHAVSLYQMMDAVQEVGAVTPELLIGGLRVSLVAPIYSLGIFGTAMVLRFLLGALPARPAPEGAV